MALVVASMVVFSAGSALLASAVASPEPAGRELLPDLDPTVPSQLLVGRVGDRKRPIYELGFQSAAGNIGEGPLIIDGHRADLGTPTMVADQLVDRDGGSQGITPNVGQLRFVRSPDHRHWHLLGFMRYELRRAGSGGVVVGDRKTGFCLGDRYAVLARDLPMRAKHKVYTTRCGLNLRERLSVREGISVGYGDNYTAFLEGQSLPLTGLRSGRYVLVHRVNVDRRFRELSYDNNASSVLLDLRWRRGVPHLRSLASCPATDRCDAAPASAAATRPRVKTLATGLRIPWEIAFLPSGRALVTERPGRVRLVSRNGKLRRRPVARVRVSAQGEGGLLGLALDPDFARNRFVYLYFTAGAEMRLERWRLSGNRLRRQRSLVEGIRAGSIHDSGRIAFGPDRRLYLSTGDAGRRELAQDPNSLNGKFLALSRAQYRGSGGRPQIVSSGHRNSQGFDWQPGTRRLIATEHGPTGFDGPEGYDEINDVVQGGNYGWPQWGSGHPGFIDPLRVYRAPIAPSGATFVTRAGSLWSGDYLFACLRGQQLRRLTFRNGQIAADRPLLTGRYGRLRTVVEGPRGALYVLTSNRDGRGTPRRGDDRILRITPPRR